jgi:hypothetical protein
LAGHWEILVGFAIGGILVLGLLGRLFARASISPEGKSSRDQMSGATFAIVSLISVAPLAITGIVILLLAQDGVFLEVVASACLSAAFSILALCVGLWVTRSHVLRDPN